MVESSHEFRGQNDLEGSRGLKMYFGSENWIVAGSS